MTKPKLKGQRTWPKRQKLEAELHKARDELARLTSQLDQEHKEGDVFTLGTYSSVDSVTSLPLLAIHNKQQIYKLVALEQVVSQVATSGRFVFNLIPQEVRCWRCRYLAQSLDSCA